MWPKEVSTRSVFSSGKMDQKWIKLIMKSLSEERSTLKIANIGRRDRRHIKRFVAKGQQKGCKKKKFNVFFFMFTGNVYWNVFSEMGKMCVLNFVAY